MKLYKYLSFFLCVLLIEACTDDSKVMVSDEVSSPIVSTPTSGSALVITEDNLEDNWTVTWEEADYGVNLAVTYLVEIDFKDNVFYSPAIVGSTQESSVTVTIAELNDLILAELNQDPNVLAEVELRIVAQSEGVSDLISDVVALDVTTFGDDGTPPVLTSPAASSATSIDDSNLSDQFAMAWDAAEFSSAGDVTYVIEAAVAGTDFATTAILGKTTETSLAITNEALNYYVVGNLGQNEATAVETEIRIKAITSTTELMSEVISFTVNTLDATEKGVLWTPGSHQGWDPSTAGTISQVGDHLFEGYMYFAEGAGFKFTSNPDWDHTNFGYESDGVLTKDGTKDGLSIEAGYYKFKVDTSALTYEAVQVTSFGLIGTATVGGWDTSTDMTYDPDANTWSITTDLVVGALKFRADNDWAINYGVKDINAKRGPLVFDAASFDIKADGNYTVILSFESGSSPYEFNYEIIEN
ncbi:SusE outer membrane protein [Reichenbachiella faecimaris]|uniref:SusE outer membrane protein n=1 Tax=Reichenbachiella faecimaris TaxID=692418 RepID=A0A1W2GN06_REIFA|nr:SusE domain-containing protein [Reichenbachiella faecimaris]SMD37954.1 SusE outer membrane protein [Reichenbachiella faecimaris]